MRRMSGAASQAATRQTVSLLQVNSGLRMLTCRPHPTGLPGNEDGKLTCTAAGVWCVRKPV